MYLVRSEAMEEALRREGARFEGIVGATLKETTSNKLSNNVQFDVSDDGQMFMLGPDHPLGTTKDSAKVPKGVLFGALDGTRRPRINPSTGRLSNSPDDHPFSRPWLLINEDSELALVGERLQSMCFRVLTCVSIAVVAIPIAIIWASSHFRSGQSTHAQRVWMMAWLAFGICYAPLGQVTYGGFFKWVQTFGYFAPSIGGFVVVGQMLMQYGICLELF